MEDAQWGQGRVEGRGSHAIALRLIAGVLLFALAGASLAQSASTVTRTSSFTYVTSGAQTGLLASETVEPSNAQLCVTTSYTYDAYGNKTGATTANCAGATGTALFVTRTTTSTVPTSSGVQTISAAGIATSVTVAAGMFPSATKNALNQSEHYTYDPRFGSKLTLTGPNGLTTTWTYDSFGRKTEELHADGTSTVTAYCLLSGVNSLSPDTSSNSSTANGDPLACPTSFGSNEVPSMAVAFVHSEAHASDGTKMGPFSRTYTDRLGRTIRTVTESFDGSGQPSATGGLMAQDTVYSAYGVQALQTQPYFLATSSSTTTGNGDMGLSGTVFDALGRPTTVYSADPNGEHGSLNLCSSLGLNCSFGTRTVSAQTIAYTGLSTTTTDDHGYTRTEEKDPIGESVRVTDTSGAQMAKQYDAFGNLLATKDALQNSIVFTYDTRGRKLTMSDPDAGNWTYTYDAAGQLVAQQSPNELAQRVQTTMVYDALGRMTSRVDPNDYTSTWSYDAYANGSACAMGIGKLCESKTTTLLDRQVSYDSLGRPIGTLTTATNGPAMASALSYDPKTGRVATQTYPTGLKVQFGYTTRGFVQSLSLVTTATVTPLPSTAGGTLGRSVAVGATLWQAMAVDAWGKVEQQQYGNGVTGTTGLDGNTGRLLSLMAGANNTVLNQTYTWDSLNNLESRTDGNGDPTQSPQGAAGETFGYDNLNRLTSYVVSDPSMPGFSRTVNLQYNALGMLLYKSDVGNYSYGAQATSGVRPHALQTVSGLTNTTYGYDANGNVSSATSGKYANISYTSFNLPNSQGGISGPGGTTDYAWKYDENHARVAEVRTIASGAMAGTRTVWYLHPDNQGGLGFESEVNSPTTASAANPAVTSNRHFLTIGGQTIGVLISEGSLPALPSGLQSLTALSNITLVKVEYWHKDQLGSLISTTDHTGAVTARYAYDPFGKRRYPNGQYDETGAINGDWNPAINSGTSRGFTGHEMRDDIGIVNMNGRIFDPNLGIFLQTDPFIQSPGNLQNYNRYGYCFNGPLGCADPSGYRNQFWTAAMDIGAIIVAIYAPEFLEAWMVDAADGAETVFVTTTGGTAFSSTATVITATGSATAAAASGFAAGVIASGNLEGGVQGAFSGAIFSAAGSFLSSEGGFSTNTNYALGIAVHAVAGCVTGSAAGGRCGPSALSAAFAEAATPYIGSRNPIVGTLEAAIVGGTASELGGGKFSNGAITASEGYLFNCLGHPDSCSALFAKAGATIGTGLGALAGIGASGACDLASGGGCAPFNPVIVAGAAVEGGLQGGVAGAAVGAAVDTIAAKVNGNSWLSPDPTSVYVLNSNVDGSILKFGITNLVGNETARYSFDELTALNANMTVIATYDSRAPARMLEIGLCTAYVAANGKLPPASSRC